MGVDFFSRNRTHCSFHGNINASVYKELLRLHAFPHLHKGTVETPIFIQDNAPWHKAKIVKFS